MLLRKALQHPMTCEQERTFRRRYGKRAMVYKTERRVPLRMFMAYIVLIHRPKGRLRTVSHYASSDDLVRGCVSPRVHTSAVFYHRSYPVTAEAERMPIIEV